MKENNMDIRKAIEILLYHAGQDMIGQGCGIRTAPSKEQKEKARKAAKCAFAYIYGWKPTETDLHNYGFH